jgi:Uma2 family endonuclease
MCHRAVNLLKLTQNTRKSTLNVNSQEIGISMIKEYQIEKETNNDSIVSEPSVTYGMRYTYADYLTWLDDVRRELIDGFVRVMSPAPAPAHQRLSTSLSATLFFLVKKYKGNCEVFTAPFDVRLPKNNETDDSEIYTVVQPDICVICNLSKIDNRGCLGAPDLIVEIESPSTAKYDMNEKFSLYERSGVREYWIASPKDKSVTTFILQPNGKYDKGKVYKNGKIPVHIFGDVEFDLNEIF